MEIIEGLLWRRVYYTRGSTLRSKYSSAINDPPCSGWQSAVIIEGPKHSTIFCPYTFESWMVPNSCGEIATSKSSPFHMEWFKQHITKTWDEMQSRGWSRDYDIAASILKRLNFSVPEEKIKGGEVDNKVKGGKPVADRLIKPVKKSSKRGKFLSWFLGADGSRSVRETMAEFSITRSNAVSYLYMLNKDNGLGYNLIGDTATIILPKDCENPFGES